MIEVWKRQKGKEGTLINFTEAEKCLLDYLEVNEKISVSKYPVLHISVIKKQSRSSLISAP